MQAFPENKIFIITDTTINLLFLSWKAIENDEILLNIGNKQYHMESNETLTVFFFVTLRWNENKIISNLVQVKRCWEEEGTSRLLIRHKRSWYSFLQQMYWKKKRKKKTTEFYFKKISRMNWSN